MIDYNNLTGDLPIELGNISSNFGTRVGQLGDTLFKNCDLGKIRVVGLLLSYFGSHRLTSFVVSQRV
jgi:hypothetical protein